jgi:AcrR family transcriptional regulator
MGRWEPNASGRLRAAALELYVERGFEQTTVAEIAARAGLTARTFFRHFADKREVLFGSAEISELAARHLTEAPASMSPATLVMHGLQHITRTRFEGRKEELRRRRAIIQSDAGLRERNLHKRAAARDALARELVRRGLDATEAALYAEVGVLALFTAIDEWLDQDDDRTLFGLVLDSLESLREVMAGFSAVGATGSQWLDTQC